MIRRVMTMWGAAVMLCALTACQSRKEGVQLACDSPKRVDDSLPPAARGQALASFIDQNVKNDDVLAVLTSAEHRTEKAKKLEAMATAEGVASCELARLWATPPLPPLVPRAPMSARPGMSAPAPLSSGGSSLPASVVVVGALKTAQVTNVIDENEAALTTCYKEGLRRNKGLEGRIQVRFVIGPDGKVKEARDAGSALPDAEVVSCVVDAISELTFPKPEEGEVTVIYPVRLQLGK